MDLTHVEKIKKEEHLARRNRVLSELKNNSAMLVFGNKLCRRNNDCDYPFRQDSYFWYLTGFDEPDALLVLSKRDNVTKSIIFVQPKDKLSEIWSGRRTGVEKAVAELLIDEAYNIEDVNKKLPEVLSSLENIYYSRGLYEWGDTIVDKYLEKNFSINELTKEWFEILDEMRLIKSKAELALLQQAAEISALAHIRVIKNTIANAFEYELEGEFISECFRYGSRFVAYNTIVGSAANGCILHYVVNDSQMDNGKMVLVDAGCEVQYYAADITRTIPVNGKFSKEQREIYNLVLEAQEEGIKKITVGSSLKAANDVAVKIMVKGLVKLGLLTGDVDTIIAEKGYLRFYMHGIGHWLGLDVHDVGSYSNDAQSGTLERGSSSRDRFLEPNMVLTVEPGIYIPDEDDIPVEYRGIGVRIEDDIVVTELGPKVISSAVPKTIEEIEELMKK